MKRYSYKSIFGAIFSISILMGCQKTLPDINSSSKADAISKAIATDHYSKSIVSLVAVPAKGIDLTVLNGRIEDYQIEFTVSNLGSVPAPATSGEISYRCNSTFKTVMFKVSSIPAASGVNLSVPVETICFESDIQFTVTADFLNVVKETNETNNTYTGIKIN